ACVRAVAQVVLRLRASLASKRDEPHRCGHRRPRRLSDATNRLPPSTPGLGDMQPDINAQLGTFFDEDQPHPVFSQKMRGYDQEEVEAHLREMDARLRDMRQSYQATQQEIAYLH